MKALGMICGIGSMLIGAKRQGFEIVGNIEWRPYYHTGTFEKNFPGSFMVKKLSELTQEQESACQGLDLLMGHTECGAFSSLRAPSKNKELTAKQLADVPEFVEAIQKFKPKFFAMDNLPRLLENGGHEWWSEKLPEYDIFFEWISNYNYGNIQKHRNRLFVIGARKKLGFYFVPGEFEHSETIRQRISKIKPGAANNTNWKDSDIALEWRRYYFDHRFADKSVEENKMTYTELKENLKGLRPNSCIPYLNKKGIENIKIGVKVVDIDRHAPVINGGGAPGVDSFYRTDTLMPFTIRERAKIQGCPDDFEFVPDGEPKINKDRICLIKQTGKFMPVEFCSFLTQQIKDFLEFSREDTDYSGKRIIKPNPLIDREKFLYCQNIGYSNQKKVCEFCGSKDYCNKNKDLF